MKADKQKMITKIETILRNGLPSAINCGLV